MSRNPTLDAVLNELERAGVRPRIEQTKSSHYRVSWGPHRVIVSNSASDGRAQLNARAEVRRKLRATP